MALSERIINGIIDDFNKSKDRVVEEIKKGLYRNRKGYRQPHGVNVSGALEKSIQSKYPTWDGNNLKWEFESERATALNVGIPMGVVGKPFYEKITKWAMKKYSISDYKQARQIAGKIGHRMKERKPQPSVVKQTGWFDEIENKVYNTIDSIMTDSVSRNVNMVTSKNLNKTIK